MNLSGILNLSGIRLCIQNIIKEDKMARDGKFKFIDEGVAVCQVKKEVKSGSISKVIGKVTKRRKRGRK